MELTAPAIVPYDYQEECLEVLEEVEKHQDTALVVKAGGLGKTITSAFYVRHRFETYHERRCLYLSHLSENLEQAEEDYRKVMSNITYGYFNGEQKVVEEVNVLFATIQTMKDNLHLFHPETFDIIVVDESHHSKAPTHEKVISYFAPHFILAITATPDRMDGLDIRTLYGHEVYYLSFVNALCRNKLCPIDYRVMTDEIGSLKKLQTEKGRLSINYLNRTVFVPKRDEEIVRIIQSNIDEIDNPCVMIYVSSTEHAELLAEMIPGSVPIHNKVPKAERKIRLALFRQGIFKVLISVDMFNESLDVPQINLVVFLRATNSRTVFYQQLMRGCRPHPSKKNVRVLDFVANCDRILQVYTLWSEVKAIQEQQLSIDSVQSSGGNAMTNRIGINHEVSPARTEKTSAKKAFNPFVLNVDSVEFKEKVVPLIETIIRIRSGSYATWQEASESVVRLEIKNRAQHKSKCFNDDRLPYCPWKYYEDYPGDEIFFGVSKFYAMWQEAALAAIALGIKTSTDYKARCGEDEKLPHRPDLVYDDFPGYPTFLRDGEGLKEWYETWEEASKAALDLGITKEPDYRKEYKKDPLLPGRPDRFYSNFPGWGKFFEDRNNRRGKYQTWQEASAVIRKMGIKNINDYLEKFKTDIKLPAYPAKFYENFPGWPIFTGRREDTGFYKTWQDASVASLALSIANRNDYKKNYKKDKRLPSMPDRIYKDFPGWKLFLTVKNEVN